MTTGVVYCGEAATPLPPKDRQFFHTKLDEGFREVGYLSDDGVTIQEGRWRRSWRHPFRVRYAPATNTVEFTLLGELDRALVTPPNTGWAKRLLLRLGIGREPRRRWVFQLVTPTGRMGIALPDALIAEIGDLNYSRGEIAATTVRIKAWPDHFGASVYVMTDDGEFTG